MAGTALPAGSDSGEAGRPPGRRGRPRDSGVDAAIRSAALDLLGETGYGRLTMEQVAARARVSKDSLYRRFPDKLTLVTDALARHARAVPDVPDTGSLPADMREFLRALLRSRGAAQRALAGVSSEIAVNPELRAAWHQGLGGMLAGCVREIVTRAAARGELPPDADLDLLSQLPLSLLRNWRLEHAEQPGEDVADRIVRQFYPPGPPPGRPGEGGT